MTGIQRNTRVSEAKELAVMSRASNRFWKKLNGCVLFVGPWADCKFYSAWLGAIAELQKVWAEACKDKQFSREVETLNGLHIPNFEIAGSTLMMRLERKLTSVIVDLDSDYIVEFCMMCSLGLFELDDKYYAMAIPKSISLYSVKQAALTVAKLSRHFDRHPERVVAAMPRRQAVALQNGLLKQLLNSHR